VTASGRWSATWAGAVEPVGSTAIRGQAGKAILDVDLVSSSDIAEAIGCLGRFGYQHAGEPGVCGRQAFASPPGGPPHHLDPVVPGTEALHNHIGFRDSLRTHPEKSEPYGQVKRKLAERFADDRDGSTDAKTWFVEDVLRRAREIART
jgi:GrpB-like predicted nucleotidyltransferase (UPF0157 family)